MVLHTMRWPDEIRRPDFAFLDEDVAVRPQELQMAEALITSMTGEFDPAAFTDDYREAMTALLEAKQSGGDVQPVPETADPGAAVVDLMSALRRSVERARGGTAPETDDDTPARPAKKVPAKKATPAAAKATAARRTAKKSDADDVPADKASTRKTPAKKAPAKKAVAAKPAPADKPPAKRARRSA
jgi:DNA end-binding protein Ku